MIFWAPILSVNVKEIDQQHQHFMELMNNTYENLYNSKIKENLGGILDEIFAYAKEHFATEEKYFLAYQYELADEHMASHRMIESKIDDFKLRFPKEGEAIVSEFLEFLEQWLVVHIGEHDKKYTKCFNDHGLY